MTLEKPKILKGRDEAPASANVIDIYESALRELFFIENPQLKKEFGETVKRLEAFLSDANVAELWIHYPWSNTLIRSVPEETYFKLRTARNRNIITAAEQLRYRNAVVGIAGLSVGSAILSALVISGGPKTLKIADFDVLETSNLNRVRATLPDVGKNKAHVAARHIWELDPFADIHLCAEGVSRENLEAFLLHDPPLQIFIDAMDNLALKVFSRQLCREYHIPVLMATDNGDGVILDIERFDSEPARPLLHGLIDGISSEDLVNMDYERWLELATRIVGPEYLTKSMQKSLPEIGRSLSALPQLGTAAMLAGSAVAYAVRRIVNREEVLSGRYLLSLEDMLDPSPQNRAHVLT